jgi:FtsP/CotA-like multicopper oxidase with cupredoxin domain
MQRPALFLALLLGALSPHVPSTEGPLAVPNDNRRPVGRMRDGVQRVALVAREAMWRPDLEAPPIPIYAFAEEREAPRIPGPLIRVRAGTKVRVVLRNALRVPMLVRGLQERPVAGLDSVMLAPGESHEFDFTPSSPGTYYYWGQTSANRERLSEGIDGQLLGALVVDPATGPIPEDRIWVLGLWLAAPDSARDAAGIRRPETLTMNGLTWPFTERLSHAVGDTVRYRVINANPRSHPMHLHGFYFTVDAAGTAAADTIYPEPQRRLAVTERMVGGSTFAMTWVPARAGNWLFHCHLIAHVTAARRLATPAAAPHEHGGNHALNNMAGLVVGIHVKPRRGKLAQAPDPVARRHLNVHVTERANVYGARPGFSYILQEGASPPAADSIRLPSSPIVLTRGEPTEITVHNRSSQSASIHWHGIELESFYDGVGDWSGYGSRTAPPIAAGDSFVVRLTPDRAGTFIYHTHSEEGPLLVSGLYGELIILEPGEQRDYDADRVLLLGQRPVNGAPDVINGSPEPPPLEMTVGKTYRLRFINIVPNNTKFVRLVGANDEVAQWRLFAKDGANLPAHQATVRAAQVTLGPGETYDFEYTPTSDAPRVLEVRTGQRTMKVPLRVRP